jgi:drug/metabolite transporter (DMT)-like permease
MKIQIAFICMSGFCFSVMSLLIKLAHSAQFNFSQTPLSAVSVVFLRSAPIIPIIVWWGFIEKKQTQKNPSFKFSKNDFFWLNIRGFVGALSMFCVFYSNIHISLGTSVMLYNTNPFFLTLLAPWMLKEKINKQSLLICVLGFFSVGILMLDSLFQIENLKNNNFFQYTGLAAGIGGGFFSALAYSSVKRLSGLPSSWVILSLCVWGVLFSSALFLIPVQGSTISSIPSSKDSLLLCILASIPAFFGQIFLTKAYQKGNTQKIAPAQYFAPFCGFFLGALFLQEEVTISKVIGSCGVIACGVILPFLKNITYVRAPLFQVNSNRTQEHSELPE